MRKKLVRRVNKVILYLNLLPKEFSFSPTPILNIGIFLNSSKSQYSKEEIKDSQKILDLSQHLRTLKNKKVIFKSFDFLFIFIIKK